MNYYKLTFNITIFLLGAILFHTGADQNSLWYEQVEYTVLDKAMHQKKASKGKVYDDPYLLIEKNSESEWNHVHTKTYLNTAVGDTYLRSERKKTEGFNWRTVMVLSGTFLILIWVWRAAVYMTEGMS